MKKRMIKKNEKKKRELMHQILDMVLDINGLEARTQETTGNKPTAFMYLFGNAACLDVNLHVDGWKADNICKREEAYFDKSLAELSQMLDRIKKMKEEL